MAEIQSQIRHIQQITAAKDIAHLVNLSATENTIHKIQGKLILTRRHRRVACKDAFFSHCLYVGEDNGLPATVLSLLIQQLDRKQTGVPFVHMEPPDLVVAQGAEHLHPADTKNHFLAKPVVLIAAVKIVGQGSVRFGIFRQVGIQEINRHVKLTRTLNFVSPGSKLDSTTFYVDCSALRHLYEKVFDDPVHRLLNLPPTGIEALVKIASTMQERHPDHRDFEIGSSANGVTGKDT
jgi:hypothetical protein